MSSIDSDVQDEEEKNYERNLIFERHIETSEKRICRELRTVSKGAWWHERCSKRKGKKEERKRVFDSGTRQRMNEPLYDRKNWLPFFPFPPVFH